jgi:hypothetical protein
MHPTLSFLFAAVLAGPTPAILADDRSPTAVATAAVRALEAIYGPRSEAGFGSAVFVESDVAEDELELVALGTYRSFLGKQWEQRESAWRGGFRLLHTRPANGSDGIVAELSALNDPALRSILELLVDNMEDPAAARAALAGAFDGPAISQLRLYALGDGEQYSGVEIAARNVDGQAVFLLLLLD